jgi:uncharacterized cupredoxin-like copper-binding protein
MELGVHNSVVLRRWAAVPMVIGLAVSVSACSGSSKKDAGKPVTPTAAASKSAAPTVAPAPKFTRVVVTATDFKLALSKQAGYKAGNYTFSLKNSGRAKHSFLLNGPGLKMQTSAVVTAGQTTDLIVPMKKGTYQWWSAVAGDKAKGMNGSIVVS